MNYFEIFILVFTVFYFVFLVFLILPWIKNEQRAPAIPGQPAGVSIVIPFRNENENVLPLLNSLQSQSGDFEVIWVNDHSDDGGEAIVSKMITSWKNIRLFSLGEKEEGKKSAIECGVKNARFDYVLTTDADVILPQGWVETHGRFLSQGADMVSGLVKIKEEKKYWNFFQQLDLMAIQGIVYALGSYGHPVSVSGANLSYPKKVFEKSEPYKENKKVLSGDDIYFMQSVKRQGGKIIFTRNKNIIVETLGVSFVDYFRQRIRWMRKSSSWNDFLTGITGFFFSISVFLFLFCTVYQLITLSVNSPMAIYMTFKMAIDFLLLFLVARHFGNKKVLFFFIPSFLLNMVFTMCISLFGWFIPVRWKARSV